MKQGSFGIIPLNSLIYIFNISFEFEELYTIGGNANGKFCMFPFLYKDRWYSDCSVVDSPDNRLWCSVETKYEHELWGYCPTNSKC